MAYKDHKYIENRLKELRGMSTEEVASRHIRATTPKRIRAVILAARKEMQEKKANPQADSFEKAQKKKLKDGDVLLMRNHGTLMQNVIAGVTGSPYTHAAIYSNGKVFDSLNATEGKKTKGGNINTLADFAERDKGITYDVYRPKDEEAAQEVVRNIKRITKETKGYSNANAVQAGLRDRFGFGFTTNHSKNYRICSELVYDAFNGRIGSDVSSSVSPGRLAKNKHLEKTHTLKLSIDAINRVKTLFKHSKRT